jgi:CO/xanthine dehydrogenase FAD-binding subunit
LPVFVKGGFLDALLNNVFFPESFQELFSVWNRFPQAVPYAGGTHIIRKQGKNNIELPKIILCLDKLKDLHIITRTEQFLEIGAMVKLSNLLNLGKIVPKILCICLENIAGVQLRNLATIGGNICSLSNLYDLHAPLAALDAQYELKTTHRTRWVSAARFNPVSENNVLEDHEILSRIRLPLYQWDYSIYKKFYSEDNYNSEILVFLVRAEKRILTEIRVVYKSKTLIRNKNSEDILNGRILPFSRKTANEFVENWKIFLSGKDNLNEFSKNALLNNIEENIAILSE